MVDRSRRTFLSVGTAIVGGLGGCVDRIRPGRTSQTSTATTTSRPPTARQPTSEGPPADTTDPNETSESTPATDHEAVRWWFDVGDGVSYPPEVGGTTAFVGGGQRTYPETTPSPDARLLTALDTTDGTERWTYAMGNPLTATPLVHGDTLYAMTGIDFGLGGRDFTLVALDPHTGRERWHLGPRSSYLSLLAVTDDDAFVATSDDEISPTDAFTFGIDAKTGSKRWKVETGDAVHGAANRDTVFVDAPDGLAALDAQTGSKRWQFGSDGFGMRSTIVGDALLAEHDGLVSLDPATGEPNWRFELAASFVTDWSASETVTVAGTYDGAVVAFDTTTGERRWATEMDDQVRPISTNGDVVLVGDLTGTVVARGAGSGTARWRFETGGREIASLALVGDRVYALVDDREAIVAIHLDDGTEQWRFAPGGELTEMAADSGGVLVGSDAGTLYALA